MLALLVNFIPIININSTQTDILASPDSIDKSMQYTTHTPIAIFNNNFAGFSGDGSSTKPYLIDNLDENRRIGGVPSTL